MHLLYAGNSRSDSRPVDTAIRGACAVIPGSHRKSHDECLACAERRRASVFRSDCFRGHQIGAGIAGVGVGWTGASRRRRLPSQCAEHRWGHVRRRRTERGVRAAGTGVAGKLHQVRRAARGIRRFPHVYCRKRHLAVGGAVCERPQGPGHDHTPRAEPGTLVELLSQTSGRPGATS